MRYWLSLAIGYLTLTTTAAVNADLLITGGTIYTMNERQPQVEALVIRDDRILFAGGLNAAKAIATEPQIIDLKGATATPGIIEGHGHLLGMGFSQLNLNLADTKSYEEMVAMVANAVKDAEPGEWILGRGWHQSKWIEPPERVVKGFQTHEKLSAVSPDNPVFLRHASGHAAMANAKAMEIAGINSETEVEGDGEVIKDEKFQPTGVLNEVAQYLVQKHVPAASKAQRARALNLALDNLAKNGVTSFHDAGVSRDDLAVIQDFADNGQLTSRVWVMLRGSDPELLLDWYRSGPLVSDYLTVRAIKLVADGALGSRGAWLLEPYTDMPGHVGLPTMPVSEMADISAKAFKHNFQVGIHAIGDRGNREVLDIFDELFEGKDQGVRFRIEHAQHLSAQDIPRFGQLGVIASMQGIHMSSDRPWAILRLGQARIDEGAYVWRKLLDTGAVVMNGTDVPVEPITPIASYYSLVTRQTLAGLPEGGYEPAQKLTRMEALRSYTLDAAYGGFEDHLKGSLQVGKFADITVFDQDLITVPDQELLNTSVVMTIVGGKVVYQQTN